MRLIVKLCVCRSVIDEAAAALRNAAGNYYVNDKSTGSVVAQQPFGGARASGKTCFSSSRDQSTQLLTGSGCLS